MGYLKIAFYGLLAFIERHPIFCLIMVALAVGAPMVFKWVGWVILGIIAFALIGVLALVIRFKRMQRQMEEQMRQAGGGFTGGFAGSPFAGMGGAQGAGNPFAGMGGAANGMTLEEFVRRMQAEADARQQAAQPKAKRTAPKSDVDSSEYVDFEEVK